MTDFKIVDNKIKYEKELPVKYPKRYRPENYLRGAKTPITGIKALNLSEFDLSVKSYESSIELELTRLDQPTTLHRSKVSYLNSGFKGKTTDTGMGWLIVDPFKATFDIIAFNLNDESMDEALEQFDENGWLYDFKQYLSDHHMENFVSDDKYTPVGYELLKENGWEVLLPDEDFHSDYTRTEPPFQY